MKPDKFTDVRLIYLSEDGKTITLARSFEYYRRDRKLPSIIVPEGFVSDGFTSLCFKFLIPNISAGFSSSILHDYILDMWRLGLCSRKYADDVFYEALLETKVVSKFRAKILYLAVRFYAILKRYK